MTEVKEGPPNFQLRLVMPSDPRFLPVVRATIGKLALVLGSSNEESRATVLAIDEALANVIRHAYHSELDKPIKFICEVRTLQLDFRIIDKARLQRWLRSVRGIPPPWNLGVGNARHQRSDGRCQVTRDAGRESAKAQKDFE